MLKQTDMDEILIYKEVVDMRMSFNGLVSLTRNVNMRFDIETLRTMNKAELISALLAFQDKYKDLDKSHQQSKQSEEKLANKFKEVSKELETAKQEIVDLNTNVEKLKHLRELFKRQIFGKKSEKVFTQSLQFGG